MDGLFIGALFILAAGAFVYYFILPEGSETSNPIRKLFGKSTYFNSPEDIATNATEQYKLLTGMYEAKNETLKQISRQPHIPLIENAKTEAEISGYRYTAAINDASAQEGLPTEVRSEIAILRAKQNPNLVEKEHDALLNLEMYLFEQAHEAGRRYYELKAEKASKRELDAQREHWDELKREWQNISQQKVLRTAINSQPPKKRLSE